MSSDLADARYQVLQARRDHPNNFVSRLSTFECLVRRDAVVEERIRWRQVYREYVDARREYREQGDFLAPEHYQTLSRFDRACEAIDRFMAEDPPVDQPAAPAPTPPGTTQEEN